MWPQKLAFWSLRKMKEKHKTYEETLGNVRSQANVIHMSLPSLILY
jgi:hypothetical protein